MERTDKDNDLDYNILVLKAFIFENTDIITDDVRRSINILTSKSLELFEIKEEYEKEIENLNKKCRQTEEKVKHYQKENLLNLSVIDSIKRLLGLLPYYEPEIKDPERFKNNCLNYKISNREKDIIVLTRLGKTYSEIASDLNITERTVSSHFVSIYRKVGVKNQILMLRKLYEE